MTKRIRTDLSRTNHRAQRRAATRPLPAGESRLQPGTLIGQRFGRRVYRVLCYDGDEIIARNVRHADILVALSAVEVAEEFALVQRAQWASPNGCLVERVGNSLERQSRGCLTVGIGPKHRGWDMELDGMIAILQI